MSKARQGKTRRASERADWQPGRQTGGRAGGRMDGRKAWLASWLTASGVLRSSDVGRVGEVKRSLGHTQVCGGVNESPARHAGRVLELEEARSLSTEYKMRGDRHASARSPEGRQGAGRARIGWRWANESAER